VPSSRDSPHPYFPSSEPSLWHANGLRAGRLALGLILLCFFDRCHWYNWYKYRLNDPYAIGMPQPDDRCIKNEQEPIEMTKQQIDQQLLTDVVSNSLIFHEKNQNASYAP
jgi:hypothetical protein